MSTCVRSQIVMIQSRSVYEYTSTVLYSDFGFICVQHINLVLITTQQSVFMFASDFQTQKQFSKRPNGHTGHFNMSLIEPTTKSIVVARTIGYKVQSGHNLWQWDLNGATQDVSESLKSVGVIAWGTCVDRTRYKQPFAETDMSSYASPSSYLFTSDPIARWIEVRALCFQNSALAYHQLRAFDAETRISNEGRIVREVKSQRSRNGSVVFGRASRTSIASSNRIQRAATGGSDRRQANSNANYNRRSNSEDALPAAATAGSHVRNRRSLSQVGSDLSISQQMLVQHLAGSSVP